MNFFYEDELLNRGGIDRVVINKVILNELDRSILRRQMNFVNEITFDDTSSQKRRYYETINGEKFYYLKINDAEMGTITFKPKIGSNKYGYGTLLFSPKNVKGHNLTNFQASDLQSFITKAVDMWSSRYGLFLDFSFSEVKEIEFNTTFPLEYPFDSYRRVLSIMLGSMPRLKVERIYKQNKKDDNKKDKKKAITSHTASNDQTSVCVYNKSLEMAASNKLKENINIYDEDGVMINKDLMRIEFKLKNPGCCRRQLNGYVRFSELNEEIIQKVFKKLVEKYISGPYEKWREENTATLRREVKRHLKFVKKGQHWKGKLLSYLRSFEINNDEVLLLDVEDLQEVVQKFPDKSGHIKRRQEFLLYEDDPFNQQDGKKYTEILDKLEVAINNVTFCRHQGGRE